MLMASHLESNLLSLCTPLLAQVLFQIVQTGSLFDPVLDNNTPEQPTTLRALPSLSILHMSTHSPSRFVVVHLYQVDVMLSAESHHELDLGWPRRSWSREDAQKSFTKALAA